MKKIEEFIINNNIKISEGLNAYFYAIGDVSFKPEYEINSFALIDLSKIIQEEILLSSSQILSCINIACQKVEREYFNKINAQIQTLMIDLGVTNNERSVINKFLNKEAIGELTIFVNGKITKNSISNETNNYQDKLRSIFEFYRIFNNDLVVNGNNTIKINFSLEV